MTCSCLSRRTVLGALGGGATATVLAGCGGGADGADGSTDPAPAPRKGAGIVATADVPVGSGVILKDQKLVVTQPEDGTFKAFSAVCTHQGCALDRVEDGLAHCPCHRSAFRAETGTAERGPAVAPLPPVPVRVENGRLVAGSQ